MSNINKQAGIVYKLLLKLSEAIFSPDTSHLRTRANPNCRKTTSKKQPQKVNKYLCIFFWHVENATTHSTHNTFKRVKTF